MATLRHALHTMDHATTYTEWLEAAEHHDRLTGALTWRDDDSSDLYDAHRIRTDLRELRRHREAGDVQAVASRLDESLTRHHGDLALPELYTRAWTGTRRLVERYVEEVSDTLLWLASVPLPDELAAARRRGFLRAAHNYGRTALMLSGGGTLGWIHLGVVKALFEHDLLPTVISGASMGAMVAAGVCTRTDDEIRAMLDDLSVIRTHGLERAPGGVGLDPDVLLETIRHNCGDWTFGEAHARTGRTLNISLSPVRRGQRPRLLCDLTAEHVLIAESALASSAIPGVFPPAQLMQRDPDGTRRPYLEGERWMDGSFHGDLPKRRMARLHQVNHVIVSQTNPHVVPFLQDPRRRGVWGTASGWAGKAVLRQAQQVLSGVAQVTASTPLSGLTATARELAAQDYTGDIDLHPTFRPGMLAKAFTNATLDELQAYVLMGERATWPWLARIEVETRIGRTFERCVGMVEAGEALTTAPRA